MIKIFQFGEGNFLRTFVDVYFDALNKENLGDYKVIIAKPASFGSIEKFVKQNYKYHVVLRGVDNNKCIEEVRKIDVLEKVFSPFEDENLFYDYAKDPEIKIIVSNTTEAGIAFNADDDIKGFANITYPAKLTKFLYERYNAKLNNVYLLPVELIENNADELYKCVDKYITLWNLGEDFRKWNNQNYYCNTLVDRVVSGYPKDEETKNHLISLIGENDELVSIGEPFGLWVIQNKGQLNELIKNGKHNIDVILTDNVDYYKKRKVRILNGSHTNMVPLCLWYQKENVYDCMNDELTKKFFFDSLNEIIPFVSSDVSMTKQFAEAVYTRFLNPFINHQLTSIALNSISKWKARVLPTYVDYYYKNHQIPHNLTIGFAYLINMYQRIYKQDNSYFVKLPNRIIEVKDDIANLEYFHNHNLLEFLKDTNLWGMDLTTFENLTDTINEYLIKINKGENLL